MTFGPILGDSAAPYALFTQRQRAIGTLIPHVVIEEVHHDDLMITVHPVETGSPVTDHSFKMPKTVEIKCGWSDSTAQAEGFVQAVYDELIAMQETREPVSISTGKRFYRNMLLRGASVRTSEESEYALFASVVGQEVIFANTQTAAGSGSGGPSNGSSSVAPAGSIEAQNATAAGFSTDANGNVSFPNGVAPGGNLSLTGPTLAQTPDNIFGPSTAATLPSFNQVQAAYAPS